MKNKIAWKDVLIIGSILIVFVVYVSITHVSNTPPINEYVTNCSIICKSYNYQYGICRDEHFGCAPHELNLGKDEYGCVNTICCCGSGCDYVCKEKGYGSGQCRGFFECEEGEINLGSDICVSGWPTTALMVCCCKR